jgi:AcrR family transcriptional regulator
MARQSTRTAILDAAEDLARSAGLVRVTTKAVAAAAGCSEASIYYHFRDRTDLLAEVVAGRFAELTAALADMRLPDDGGATQRLAALIEAVANMYAQMIGLSSSLLADPDVLARFRAVLEQRSLSLHGMQGIVAGRIRREQQDGRLRSDVDANIVALLIAGTCHEVALEAHLMGDAPHFTPAEGARRLAAALATMLDPGERPESS